MGMLGGAPERRRCGGGPRHRRDHVQSVASAASAGAIADRDRRHASRRQWPSSLTGPTAPGARPARPARDLKASCPACPCPRYGLQVNPGRRHAMAAGRSQERSFRPTGLKRHLKDPDLRVLDASWYLPDAGRDPKAEYEAAHIPGARFFDIDEISDQRSALPHMAPPPEKFISRMRAMGVGDGHQVVVYDGAGIFSAPRVWWTFRLMGKTDVAVLDGGFPEMAGRGARDRGHAPHRARPPHDRQRQNHAGQGRDAGRPCREAGRGRDHRRPPRRPLPGRGAGTPPRPAVGAYSRLEEHALRDASEPRRHDEGRRRADGRVRGRRGGPDEARRSPPAGRV